MLEQSPPTTIPDDLATCQAQLRAVLEQQRRAATLPLQAVAIGTAAAMAPEARAAAVCAERATAICRRCLTGSRKYQ